MSEAFDLSAHDTAKGGEAGYDLKLKTVEGREVPGHIRIRGYDSETYQRTLDEQQRRRLARVGMGKTPTVEEMNGEALELAAALVIGWTCPFTNEGKAFPYSPTNAQELLRGWRWVREQVERAAGVRANFLPGSSAS